MLRGAHSEHTAATWGINLYFLSNMEHASAIWRIALQIALQWHKADVLRRIYVAPLAQTACPEHTNFL